ncbi:uncharacterized protein [Dermacentor albipictus]|uniref:uncharacterized protein isoform X5 n=1 Tax=Dermacentor albipictus TaxID=60249 RepID=UPI0031FD94B0
MGKVKLKATKGNSDDKRPLDLKKGDSKPLVAGGQPEVQGSATGLGPALSTAVAGMAKTKKQKRKMRHEAFIRKLEAGKIVKRKRWKKACVPRALDLKNLVDALPTMVERTAVKLGAPWLGSKAGAFLRSSPVLLGSRGAGDSGLLLNRSHHSSYSGTATCSQLLHGQSGDGDAAAGHSRWDQHGDCRVHRQDYAERRRQVPMGIVPPSASNSGQKRGRDESLGHPRASKQARSCWRRT